ncbi:MAG: NADPH:quinone reductase [Verrucomicrobiae bacterium]|nr:NADPH:quinone reductase [Verrucomicrobiae bacterium]
MKAAYYLQTGPPEVLTVGELPTPKPGPTQCLVRVGAADVNPIDTYIRAGLVPATLTFPHIPGCSLAGTVIETGPQVARFKPGDRVWATNLGVAGRPGTLAEFAAVEESLLYPIPPGVRDEDAAALALVGMTAHIGLFRKARLQPGETLLVNGGAGGVGSAVVQMARIAGARVIATAGSDAKVAACRELGAELALNYKTQDLAAAVKAFAPDGLNVWWETSREPDFERAIPLLALRGRMIVMAGRDARPVFPVGPFYTRDATLLGFVLFNAAPHEQRAAAEDMNRWMAEGRLKARIDRILPLSEAATAHRLQEESTIQRSGALAGKIVIKP